MQDISIVKEFDKSSPKLAEACAREKLFPKIEIEFVTAGGNEREYLVYTLENCVITGFSTQGSSGDPAPSEELTLSYEKVSWEYRQVQPTQRSTPSFSRPTPSHP